MVSVRDARVHEDHPLLGIVYIDLAQILRKRQTSRINDFFPLAGGIGYGRLRISLVFRSVQMQPLPKQLGWDWVRLCLLFLLRDEDKAKSASSRALSRSPPKSPHPLTLCPPTCKIAA